MIQEILELFLNDILLYFIIAVFLFSFNVWKDREEGWYRAYSYTMLLGGAIAVVIVSLLIYFFGLGQISVVKILARILGISLGCWLADELWHKSDIYRSDEQ